MRYIIKILALILFAGLLIVPASAVVTNISGGTIESSTFLHDAKYMPASYVYVLIIIGMVSLIFSRIIESAEDLLSIGAVLPLGLSAWYANYMTHEYTSTVTSSATGVGTNIQIITPNPYLSLTMTVFFILSLINVIWILYLRDADKKTGGE